MATQTVDVSALQRDVIGTIVDEIHEAQRTSARSMFGTEVSLVDYPEGGTEALMKLARESGDDAALLYGQAIEHWRPLLTPMDFKKPPPPAPPASVGPIRWDGIAFSGGVPVGGWSHLSLWSDGSYVFEGSFHDSGFPSYNDELVWVVKDKLTNTAYTFRHSGHMAGTLESGSRDDNWNVQSRSLELQQAWPNFAYGWLATGHAGVNWDLNALVNDALAAAGTVLAVVAIV